MEKNLALRLKAEKTYLELQAKAEISRAINSRTKPSVHFVSGDLVYYQRYKVPADNPANNLVDMARLRVARWYCPGRVLACETRVQEQGEVRVASSTVWIVAQGRLKTVHADQLRHASETEKALADANPATSLPWTLSTITSLFDRDLR